ncbi:alpha/beta fold hydrolase [Granulicella arctica]|uniref:Pimeloyl-ACP methyl ester carboxylesterase n=1 Tax=Granulicella arctica TaxID=940613 RepID=A0A7Y9THM7_9BACT|nr:alpha/beta hydrolase [Granulicella arctica]NYF80724.1 pimeloyl-ACP methyl ester carboxylesterase [Granulicella arctica]
MPQISVNDITIHYEESGEGLPVILIHGHPFDATMWSPQLYSAFPGYRLLAPELRNFGRTTSPVRPADLGVYARDIFDFADSLGLQKFIVAGLSMGGQVAMELANVNPERLSGLVLADTFAQLDTPEKKQWRYALADRLDTEGLQAYAVEVLPKMLSARSIAENPTLASEVLLMMQRCPAQGAADALRVRAERRDYLPVLSELDLPTLIVVGSEDAFTSIADAELMQRGIRNSTMVIIEDAGHMPNMEKPDQFNEALKNFLALIGKKS